MYYDILGDSVSINRSITPAGHGWRSMVSYVGESVDLRWSKYQFISWCPPTRIILANLFRYTMLMKAYLRRSPVHANHYLHFVDANFECVCYVDSKVRDHDGHLALLSCSSSWNVCFGSERCWLSTNVLLRAIAPMFLFLAPYWIVSRPPPSEWRKA